MAKKFAFKMVSLFTSLVVLCISMGTLPVFAADSGVMERLLVEVSPKVTVSLRGGDRLELEALAAQGSEVTAKVNGSTVALAATSERENGAVWYSGSYTVPSAGSDQDLGRIEFTARKNGRTETRIGGVLKAVVPVPYVEVDRPEEGASGEMDGVTPVSGDIIRIHKNYADIFSSVDRGEEYASPYYYNLPANTMDYAVGTTSASYILKSGRRVSKGNATVVTNGTNGNNRITGVTVKDDGTFTTLTFRQSWAVPFNITPSPLSYTGSTNTVSSCNPTQIIITFDYTTAYSAGSMDFSRGSAFSSASWRTKMNGDIPQVELTLTLSQKGGYYGAYASYSNNGTLTLQFLNPVDSLDGARIVIDAGHGTGDPGNTAGGVEEAQINLRHAQALKEELEDRGAEVTLLETRGSSYVGVTQRAEMGISEMPHLYIAVHQNSVLNNASARGVETFYNTPYSQRLAKYINDEMYEAYLGLPYSEGAKNRGAKFSEFAVTRPKQYASVLIEYGFLTNQQEREILTNSRYDREFAGAVADGIEKFFSGE